VVQFARYLERLDCQKVIAIRIKQAENSFFQSTIRTISHSKWIIGRVDGLRGRRRPSLMKVELFSALDSAFTFEQAHVRNLNVETVRFACITTIVDDGIILMEARVRSLWARLSLLLRIVRSPKSTSV
jgi:hypothetical protein